MIQPTVGRVVLYYVHGKPQLEAKEQPFPMLVSFVHSDRCINVGGFDNNGDPRAYTSVTLLQEGDVIPAGPFAAWMPYQVQAAKEAAEKAAQVSKTSEQPKK